MSWIHHETSANAAEALRLKSIICASMETRVGMERDVDSKQCLDDRPIGSAISSKLKNTEDIGFKDVVSTNKWWIENGVEIQKH